GEIYSITGQRELADEAFGRSLQYSPGDRRVLLQLVLVHDKARDKEQADAVMMEALRLFPNILSVRIQAAGHYALYDEWSEAMAQLDRANSMLSGPDDKRYPQVAMLNAELSLRNGDPASALNSLLKVPEVTDPETLYLLARTYRALGDETKAQNILSRLLRDWKNDEIARMFREEYLVQTSKDFDAERKEAADWHLDRGMVFQEKFYYKRAYNEFRRAKLLNKDNPDVWISYTDIIRKMGFSEHYQDSLTAALVDIPESRDEYSLLKERLDLLEHSGTDSIADTWGIDDPWCRSSAEWKVGVYVLEDSSSLPVHTGAESTLALFYADLLDIHPDIILPADAGGRNPDVKTVASFADAFRLSREKLDYFVQISFTETNRTFSAAADLYLAGTGEKIGSFNELRTGQGMVSDTLQVLAASLSSALPKLMKIVSVDGNHVLLDKGRWQGIEKDETWIVVKNGAGRPANIDGGLAYTANDYLGSVSITEISEPLSVGLFESFGDFEFISPGDDLFLLPVPELEKNNLNA
ncbi:MAG: tetratricopeptide repeat protein, partial [Spirochaetaceae bacterium]|nr:tetratricopeptide repeat protein [Spirochaetaceae bacterium]